MGYVASRPVTVILDVAAWAVIHVAVGYAVHRMPAAWFAGDWWIHRPRGIERDGRLYTRTLRIRRWKRWLPEAGDVFAGGFNKRHLAHRDAAYLERYLKETRRAELGHWMTGAFAPIFLLWNPWPVAVVMAAYAVIVNGPCIAAQRYNRIRLRRVLGARP